MTDLTLRRVIDAPVKRVYAAWTDPELLKQWLAPGNAVATRAVADVAIDGSREAQGPVRCPKSPARMPRIERSSSSSGQWRPKGESSIRSSSASVPPSRRGFPATGNVSSRPLAKITRTFPARYEAETGLSTKVLEPEREVVRQLAAAGAVPGHLPLRVCLRIIRVEEVLDLPTELLEGRRIGCAVDQGAPQ